jgi:phosphonate transport system substrate-binding protein
MFTKRLTSWPILPVILFAVFIVYSIDLARVEAEDLRAGYSLSFRSVNPKDAEIAMKIWLSQLLRQSSMNINKIEPYLFDNLSDLVLAINNNKLDLFGLNSVDYVMIRNQVQLEPALVTTFGKDYGNKYVLLVNKELNVHKLSQLKGTNILLHTGVNPIPLLWLRHLLKKQGLPGKDSFFGSIKEVDKASQAILPVFFRQADACIVTCRAFETSAELNPQITKKLEPLLTSPLFTDSLVLFRKDYKSENKKIIIDMCLNLNKYPQGKQIMTLFQIDGFALFSESYLDNVIALMQKSGEFK